MSGIPLPAAAKQFIGSSSTAGAVPSNQGANGAPYTIVEKNWYKALPYGFSFFSRDEKTGDKAKSTMWLPIAPSNLNVKTHFATNIITTLYGVVEEHSEVRYYDISITGTTGYSPRFVMPEEQGTTAASTQGAGRDSFQDDSSVAKLNKVLGGFLPEVTNTLSQVSDTITGFTGGPTNNTGIRTNKSGYFAFHQLYQFFLKYKQDAAGANPGASAGSGGASKKRQVHPIQFLNYKDNIRYDCVPMDFTLIKSKESPMLYNYSIRLRAYNLRDVNGSIDEKDNLNNNLAKLGIDGLEGQSAFSKMSAIAGDAATLISAVF